MSSNGSDKNLKFISILALILMIIGLFFYVLNPGTTIQMDVVDLHQNIIALLHGG